MLLSQASLMATSEAKDTEQHFKEHKLEKKKNSRVSQATLCLTSYGFSCSERGERGVRAVGACLKEEKDPHVVEGTASWDPRSQWSPSSQAVSTGHSCPATVT